MSVKHVATIAPEQGRPGRWVIGYEPKRGRFLEANVPWDVKPDELDELFVEPQATVADRQAAMADQGADTDPALKPPPPADKP